MLDTHKDLIHAKKLASTARVFASIALVVIIISIVLKTGIPIIRLLIGPDPLATRVTAAGLLLVQILPAVLLCKAVNSLSGALKHYSEGDFFCQAAARHVAAAGDYGAQAMIASMLIVPNLSEWIQSEKGFTVRMESEYLGILAFALFVGAVGRILSAATSLKEENEAFI